MESKLAPRKPDLLDELDTIRFNRRLAYEEGRTKDILRYNQQIREMRLKHEWPEVDADEEFIENQIHFMRPYCEIETIQKFDVLDENGKPANVILSMNQLSKYNYLRGFGFGFSESLQKCI